MQFSFQAMLWNFFFFKMCVFDETFKKAGRTYFGSYGQKNFKCSKKIVFLNLKYKKFKLLEFFFRNVCIYMLTILVESEFAYRTYFKVHWMIHFKMYEAFIIQTVVTLQYINKTLNRKIDKVHTFQQSLIICVPGSTHSLIISSNVSLSRFSTGIRKHAPLSLCIPLNIHLPSTACPLCYLP